MWKLEMDQNKTVVLIGFMGVGKTTVGNLLAQKLGWDFIDIDEEIERELAMPVSHIFQTRGENFFRDKEKELILELTHQKRKVLSPGGGAFLQEDIRKECLAGSIVVFLDISWNAWKERVQLIVDSRPVLHGKSLTEMEELFYLRQKLYAEHHLKVTTDHRTPEEVTENIIHALKNEGLNFI